VTEARLRNETARTSNRVRLVLLELHLRHRVSVKPAVLVTGARPGRRRPPNATPCALAGAQLGGRQACEQGVVDVFVVLVGRRAALVV
jgi:hypothetical protein